MNSNRHYCCGRRLSKIKSRSLLILMVLTITCIFARCSRQVALTDSNLHSYKIVDEDSLNSSLYPLMDREIEMEEVYSSSRMMFDLSEEEIDNLSSEKKFQFDSLMQTMISFELNRSRWRNLHYSSTELYEKMPETVYSDLSPCSCMLNNDIIQVFTGTWLFGGQFLELKISSNGFTGTFIDDKHEYEQFYYVQGDTILLSKVEVPLVEASLKLSRPFRAIAGQQLTAELLYTSGDYYSTVYSYRYLNGKKMEGGDPSLAAKGRVVFTCQVIKEN